MTTRSEWQLNYNELLLDITRVIAGEKELLPSRAERLAYAVTDHVAPSILGDKPPEEYTKRGLVYRHRTGLVESVSFKGEATVLWSEQATVIAYSPSRGQLVLPEHYHMTFYTSDNLKVISDFFTEIHSSEVKEDN